MDLILLIYLADIINGAAFVSILLGGLFIMLAIYNLSESNEHYHSKERIKHHKQVTGLSAVTALFFIAFAVLTPSKQGIYTMVAAHYGEQMINNPEAKILGDKVLKVLNAKLDELVPKQNEKQ